MIHHEACTWLQDSPDMKPPANDPWGKLNYIWCHAFCGWPDDQRDVKATYQAAHGAGPWWWRRRQYFSHWKRHLPCCFPKDETTGGMLAEVKSEVQRFGRWIIPKSEDEP